MKPKILQTGPLSPKLDGQLRETFDVQLLPDLADRAGFLVARGADFRGIATSAPVGASTDLIAALPNLEVISCRGVGLDKIDLVAARARGIQVSGTFGVLTDCVADLAWGLMIDVTRRLPAADHFVRQGQWLQGKFPMATRISGKRLGIVGLGQIGRAVAKRAAGFDMELRYTDRAEIAGVPYGFEATPAALAEWADILVVTVAGGAATNKMISAAVLEGLGRQGYLVNVSRGSVIDEDALAGALMEGKIAGAALDVFADEPNVPEALFTLNNVVLLPHIASATNETRTAMEDLVLENLVSYFNDGRVKTPAA